MQNSKHHLKYYIKKSCLQLKKKIPWVPFNTTPSSPMTFGSVNWPIMAASLRKSSRSRFVEFGYKIIIKVKSKKEKTN